MRANLMSFNSQLFLKTVKEIGPHFELNNWAICDLSGRTIYSSAQSGADLGTLSIAAVNLFQYFAKEPGTVVISNDPFMAGPSHNAITYVTPINEAAYFVHRQFLMPMAQWGCINWNFENADVQVLQIPPTPLAQRYQVDKNILSAIASHPLATSNLMSSLESGIQKCFDVSRHLQKVFSLPGSKLTKDAIESLLELGRQLFQRKLADWPDGEVHQVVRSENNDLLLDFHVHKSESGLLFDFSKTPQSDLMQISPNTLLGALYRSVQVFTGKSVPYNHATVSMLEVMTHPRCWVSQMKPKNSFLGASQGVSLLQSAIVQSFGSWISGEKRAASHAGWTALLVQDDSGEAFFDYLPGGLGARQKGASRDRWTRDGFPAPLPTWNDIQGSTLVEPKKLSENTEGIGRGKRSGDPGVIKAYQLKKECLVGALLPIPNIAAFGIEGGGAGSPSNFMVEAPGEQRRSFTNLERRRLPAGSLITIASGGGGGLG